ncbi:MAG TPA: Na+/H+ antiporter subunit E [Thermomicrobiales bacterium]
MSAGRMVAAGAGLAVIYMMTLASTQLWDFAIGVILAAGVLAVFRTYLFGNASVPTPGQPSIIRRVIMFFPFALVVIRNIIRETLQVALVTLHVRPLVKPGIVAVPIGERTPLGVTVSALVETLAPGSFLVEVDWEERVMLVHLLDASDPDAVRAEMQDLYDRWQRHVFP